MSFLVVDQPQLTRILDLASECEIPIASKTGLASNDPEEHADPVETAIPSKSRDINKLSALIPWIPKFNV